MGAQQSKSSVTQMLEMFNETTNKMVQKEVNNANVISPMIRPVTKIKRIFPLVVPAFLETLEWT